MKITLLLAITAVSIFVPAVWASYVHMGSEMMSEWAMDWFKGMLMIIFWASIIVASVFLVDWHLQNKKGRLVPAPGPTPPPELLPS